jgi:hypothetical protein
MRTPPTLSSLPPELLISIAAYVTAKDMARMAQTCRSLRVLSDPRTMTAALSRHRTQTHISTILDDNERNIDLIVALLEKFGPDGKKCGQRGIDNLPFAVKVAAQHGRIDLLDAWFERYDQRRWVFKYAFDFAASTGNIDFYEHLREKIGEEEGRVHGLQYRAACAGQLAFLQHLYRSSNDELTVTDVLYAAEIAAEHDYVDVAMTLFDDARPSGHEIETADEIAELVSGTRMCIINSAFRLHRLDVIRKYVGAVSLVADDRRELYHNAFEAKDLEVVEIIDASVNRCDCVEDLLEQAVVYHFRNGVEYILATRRFESCDLNKALRTAALMGAHSLVNILLPRVSDPIALLRAALATDEIDLVLTIARKYFNETQISPMNAAFPILGIYELNCSYSHFENVLLLASVDVDVFGKVARVCQQIYRDKCLSALPELLKKTCIRDEFAATHHRLSTFLAML